MGYSWLATEMRTGVVIADLPLLDCEKVSSQIGSYTSTTATLPITTDGKTPENWLRATKQGASNLILLDEDANLPVWGGFVTHRTRSTDDTLSLSLASMEAYTDRRYVGDAEFDQQPQNSIVSSLVNAYLMSGSNGGIPIRRQMVGTDLGLLQDRSYTDISDKTIYSCLQELSGVEGGPEWTIGWEWSGSRITPVFYYGTRIGNPVMAGMASANATFEVPGSLTEAEYEEDYTSESGANDVMATSSASGASRPQSNHVVTYDPERPTFELRYSPSTSITDEDVLQQHAAARGAQVIDGTNSLSLASVVENAPRLGVDWNSGDDLGYVVTSPSFPSGISGVARCIGWELSLGDQMIVTPVLQDTEVED